jgi:hypothetical protein
LDIKFGALQCALVGGQYYAYFSVSYELEGQTDSQIDRVPLTGGTATTFVGPTNGVVGDMVTDGTNLYWADSIGVYEAPLVGGGPITTLVSDTTVSHLGVAGSYVYYASTLKLPSGVASQLRAVPKAGGPSSLVLNDTHRISAMYILPTSFYTAYYLGGSDGSVIEGTTIGGVTATLRGSSSGNVSVTSISRDPNNDYILWGESGTSLLGTPVNVVQYDAAGTIYNVFTTARPVDVQGDATAMYWGDSGLEKFTF